MPMFAGGGMVVGRVVHDVRCSRRRLEEERAPRLGRRSDHAHVEHRASVRRAPVGSRVPERGDVMWTLWIIGLALAIAIAAVCYRIAEGKGRRGVLWAVLGFFFPVIALVVIFVLPDKRA
jgi:hypothetical protein